MIIDITYNNIFLNNFPTGNQTLELGIDTNFGLNNYR